jgi:hypothetical protein
VNSVPSSGLEETLQGAKHQFTNLYAPCRQAVTPQGVFGVRALQSRDGMNPQKITLHRLDSPATWEWEQSERSHNRRKMLSVVAAIASVCVTTGMFYRGETVEDYSRSSAPGNSTASQGTGELSQTAHLSYLADLRGN